MTNRKYNQIHDDTPPYEITIHTTEPDTVASSLRPYDIFLHNWENNTSIVIIPHCTKSISDAVVKRLNAMSNTRVLDVNIPAIPTNTLK